MTDRQLARKQNSLEISRAINMLQDHMAHFGYESLSTPIIERAELFLTRAGDQVIDQLFTFTRRGQQLALRPEFTAIAAHRFVNHTQQAIVRWQFSGPIFVDNPNSFQHAYQQESMGAELIGLAGPAIDAEIIGLAVQGLKRIQLRDYELVIGHAGLTRHLLRRYQLDSRTEQFLLKHINVLHQPDLGKQYILEQFEQALTSIASKSNSSDELPHEMVTLKQAENNTQHMLQLLLEATRRSTTMGGRTQHDIARRLLQKQQRLTETQQVNKALMFLEDWTNIASTPTEAFRAIEKWINADPDAMKLFQDWQATIKVLDAYAVDTSQLIIQPYLTRNWEYYTGIIFEINSKDHRQLGTGGRYDELISLIGGTQSVPAVGFAYYLDQLLGCIESPSPDLPAAIYITLTNDNAYMATELATSLRQHDITVVLLPAEHIESNQMVVEINSSGMITYGGQQYTLSTVEALENAIRQENYGE